MSMFIEHAATFSPCRTYRYTLTRVWDRIAPVCCWVMLNPSTATEDVDDPTVRRVQDFADRWKCGGVIVTNLFALRSTDPRALYKHEEPIGPANDKAILDSAKNAGLVVVAWGVHGRLYGRGAAVLDMLRKAGVKPKCLGKTAGGLPVHPLYQPGSAAPIDV